MKNYIITVARGYGSGGKTIAGMLSEQLGIDYFDRDLIKMASENSGINEAIFNLADEKLRNGLFNKYKTTKIIPPESDEFLSDTNLFNFQAAIIKKLAAEEKSCIIVGRCADYILKDCPNAIKVFIYANMEHCIKNIHDMYGTKPKEAEKLVLKTDKIRSDYYKHYTGQEWYDVRNYDLCLNSGELGYQKCVDIIKNYIEIR